MHVNKITLVAILSAVVLLLGCRREESREGDDVTWQRLSFGWPETKEN